LDSLIDEPVVAPFWTAGGRLTILDNTSTYDDSIVSIDAHHVKLHRFILPFTSSITIDLPEIEEVEAVRLKPLARLNLLGTQDFETWWVFDPVRPTKKWGFVIKLTGGRFRIGFTPSDFDATFQTLANHLGSKLLDRRHK
jgi:hypothetical protein